MEQSMEIAVRRINKFEAAPGSLRAFCDVEIGKTVLIMGIRVVEGKNGLFVSMPRRQGKDGNWYDRVIPLTREVRQQISQVVLAAYGSAESLEAVFE